MSHPPTCPVCRLPIAPSGSSPAPQHLHHPHQCPFCHKSFGRADGARRHAGTCPQREGRPLPPLARRGRKLRACDQCSRVKVHCDGAMPCSRCRSRRLDCVSSWLCHDASHRREAPSQTSQVDEATKQHKSVEEAQKEGARAQVVPLLLLRHFDTSTEFENERDAADQPESDVRGPWTSVPPDDGAVGVGVDMDCVDPALLLSNYIDPLLDTYLALDDVYGDLEPGDAGAGDGLDSRLQLLGQELESLALRKPKMAGSFRRASFHAFFSSENVRRFAVAVSRKRHYQLPVIHWPTFDMASAPLPLVLAVAIMGAAYSHAPNDPSDPAVEARAYHRIAGAYIFRSLKQQVDLERGADELMGYLQAAVLMVGLGAWVKDEETWQKLKTKYGPGLARAIRRHGMAQVRHGGDAEGEDWPCFVQRETQVRVASWAFYMDCLSTLVTNHPPLMALSEMRGQAPCDAALWDAETGEAFARRRRERGMPFHCLEDQMGRLMGDGWTGPPESLPNLYHLHAMSCALIPIIYHAHVSKLPDGSTPALLRALDRWDALWAAASRHTAEEQRRWLGVARNAPGLVWLSRRILEAQTTTTTTTGMAGEGPGLRYLQRIPSYTTRDIFELVRRFGVDGEH